MTRVNTKSFALFIKAGAVPPTPPANFFEVSEKVLINPKPKVGEIERFNGTRLTTDTYSDTCDTTIEGAALMHQMKYQNAAADALDTIPEYGEVLKISGFDEVVNTVTPGQETVIYTLNNTATPSLGSALYYIDGNKQTMTNSIATNVSFDFVIGEPAKLNATMNAFVDNEGVPVVEANPTVTLDTANAPLIVSCTDLYSENGSPLTGVSNISIDLGANLEKFYGMSLKEYESTSVKPTMTAEFPLDKADYANAINLLKNQTVFDVVVELGRVDSLMVSGKSVRFKVTNVKLGDFSDADDKDTIKRTHNLSFTPESVFTIEHGYFI